MERNTNKGSGKSTVTSRKQSYNPKTEIWVRRDAATGKLTDHKADGKPFKGVTKEEVKKFGPVLQKLSDYDKGKK